MSREESPRLSQRLERDDGTPSLKTFSPAPSPRSERSTGLHCLFDYVIEGRT